MSRTDHQTIYRILDANANRLREGLRAIEEAARFGWDQAPTAAALKQMRAGLASGLARFARSGDASLTLALLNARDSMGDVGRGSALATRRRQGVADLLAANFKRVQEAARVLEEYAALTDSRASEQFEQVRYLAYDLETIVVPAAWRHDALDAVRLCVLVTESAARRSLLTVTRAAIRGGAQMIQYRNKALADGPFADQARALLTVCRKAGVLLILNDRVDVAAAIGADGVHLGEHDMAPADARHLLARHQLIGVSACTLKAVRAATRAQVDYIGAGAVYPSATKRATGGQPSRTRGLVYLTRACAATVLPVFAIGGIERKNLKPVIAAGCTRVAVCSAVIAASDVAGAARHFRKSLDSLGP